MKTLWLLCLLSSPLPVFGDLIALTSGNSLYGFVTYDSNHEMFTVKSKFQGKQADPFDVPRNKTESVKICEEDNNPGQPGTYDGFLLEYMGKAALLNGGDIAKEKSNTDKDKLRKTDGSKQPCTLDVIDENTVFYRVKGENNSAKREEVALIEIGK